MWHGNEFLFVVPDGVFKPYSTHVVFKVYENLSHPFVGRISLASSNVINVPTRASLAVETKLLFLSLAYLNNKINVCKQISFIKFRMGF